MALTDEERDALAQDVREHLQRKPKATVQELADATKQNTGEVARVLDEYLVEGDTVKHVGPGGGGGWVDA